MESLEEKIKKFLQVSSGSGYGYGDGSGYGYGDGDGSGFGYGDGYGYGDGSGFGDGDGSGYGYGDGSGDGSGDGDGSGYGYGDGSGDGLKSINGQLIYLVDGVQTIFLNIRGNVAKGAIVNKDLTLSDCYVVKDQDCFAHGKTLEEATQSLAVKEFAEKLKCEMDFIPFIKGRDKEIEFDDVYNLINKLLKERGIE